MGKRVHKFLFPLERRGQIVYMPRNARVLSVGKDGKYGAIWAEVDPAESTTARTVYVIYTGHDTIPDSSVATYIGRIDEDSILGMLRCHIYLHGAT